MEAECGCRVKSYRAKQCPYCGKWYCPPCYSEHVNSLKTHCSRKPGVPSQKQMYEKLQAKKERYAEYYGGKITILSKQPAPKKMVLSDTIHKDLGLVPVTYTRKPGVLSQKQMYEILKKRSLELQSQKAAQMGMTKSVVSEILRVRSLGLQDYLSNFVEEYECLVLEWLDKAILRARIDILAERLS